jgi:hypothetical protein
MAKEIPKSQQGKELCQAFKKNVRVCVTGRRYGYEAWLVSKTGRRLAPISVGKPNRVKKALRIAVREAHRIARGEMRPRSRGAR